MEKLSPKEFALQAIAPYYKDKSLCAMAKGGCVYLTNDGRKCVFGKYLLHPENYGNVSAASILRTSSQEEILVPEAQNILNPTQWAYLQRMHDTIANTYTLEDVIDSLDLFTMEELEEYCKNN